ncbi:MAG: phosphoribosylglycinamide formyltransferase [Clostridia bacterium]|nr:phosphoribosylglycinamide formyltransferase [Clostridia bacterium]
MLKPVRIAVLVSGGGTNLQALLDAQTRGELQSGQITLVVSDHADAYALTRAENHGVKAVVISERGEAFETKLLEVLKAEGIELVILAGFLQILGIHFIKAYEDRIINVHPSLIPSFCGKGFYGLKVHKAALEKGVKVTGATVHMVNEIPDGGRILFQKAVEILDGDTPEILQKRVMEQAEWILLPRAAEAVSRQIREEGN